MEHIVITLYVALLLVGSWRIIVGTKENRKYTGDGLNLPSTIEPAIWILIIVLVTLLIGGIYWW